MLRKQNILLILMSDYLNHVEKIDYSIEMLTWFDSILMLRSSTSSICCPSPTKNRPTVGTLSFKPKKNSFTSLMDFVGERRGATETPQIPLPEGEPVHQGWSRSGGQLEVISLQLIFTLAKSKIFGWQHNIWWVMQGLQCHVANWELSGFYLTELGDFQAARTFRNKGPKSDL